MATRKKTKSAAGKSFAKLDKPIPPGHFAFVVGDEVRITKRNTKGRPKGAKNKRQGCARSSPNKAGGKRKAKPEPSSYRAYFYVPRKGWIDDRFKAYSADQVRDEIRRLGGTSISFVQKED